MYPEENFIIFVLLGFIAIIGACFVWMVVRNNRRERELAQQIREGQRQRERLLATLRRQSDIQSRNTSEQTGRHAMPSNLKQAKTPQPDVSTSRSEEFIPHYWLHNPSLINPSPSSAADSCTNSSSYSSDSSSSSDCGSSSSD